MATPYKSNGTDFDDIFEPIGSETKAANVGYAIAGVDISNRYYPLSAGGSSPAPVGYSANGTDLSQIFAGIGTVPHTGIPFGSGYYGSKTFVVGELSADLEISLTIKTDNTWTISYHTEGIPDSTYGSPLSGTWGIGPASGYEVRVSGATTVNIDQDHGFGVFSVNGTVYTGIDVFTPWISVSDTITISHITVNTGGAGITARTETSFNFEFRPINGSIEDSWRTTFTCEVTVI